VVVPGVTALIVQTPAPMFKTVMQVPIGKATDALVGRLKAIAVALFMISKTWYWSLRVAVVSLMLVLVVKFTKPLYIAALRTSPVLAGKPVAIYIS
jgi:hypothetical protein